MKPSAVGWLLALAALCADGAAGARPGKPTGRRVAEAIAAQAAPVAEPERVVVAAGNGKAGRFGSELERELEASSFAVVRLAQVALEPQAMLAALKQARASRGVLVSEDGFSVVVFAASHSGNTLRVYGEYSVDRDNRLARRRQWISLVERLRVPAEDDDAAEGDAAWLKAATRPTSPSASAEREIPPTTGDDNGEVEQRRVARLGAAAALGYAARSTGITSHLMIVGHRMLGSRLCGFAYGMWPLVASDQEPAAGIRARIWTFTLAGGLLVDLGRAAWPVQPFAGGTVGLQFLLAYLDYTYGGQSDVRNLGSVTTDLHLGARIPMRPGTAFLIQASGGRTTAVFDRSVSLTESLADAWVARASLGLVIDF